MSCLISTRDAGPKVFVYEGAQTMGDMDKHRVYFH
jgi:hypothetical protein